ncbi:MAG TPA: DUF1648 domain-containing protein [Candidatus Tumulicola sp.]
MINVEIAFCLAVIVGTAAYTVLRYRELPDRVPLHFGLGGNADRFGPRPMIWLIVGLQIIVTAGYAVPSLAGSGHPLILVACVVVSFCWYLQTQIVSAAISGTNRIPMARFWISMAILMVAVLLAILLPH